MGIYELLILNEALRPLILNRAPASTIAQKAIEQGMRTLRTDGWNKVKAGQTTIEEVLRVTQTEEHLKSLVEDTKAGDLGEEHKMARWNSCNVLHATSDTQHLWQFSAGGQIRTAARRRSACPTEPLPEKLIGKDWQTLLQPKLNVAWLPANNVFLRVVHLARKATSRKRASMVELQLEKLSPLPVAQIVWSFELFPHGDPAMQTVVVIIAARHHVEEFLGQLETRGFLGRPT